MAVASRLLDLILAIILAAPALLILPIVAIVIKIDSPGPLFFLQVRVGRNRRPFTLYKLRTMKAGTGDKASHEVAGVQITRSGRFLRKSKLDELPQIFCILKGDMSFVGPRPCLPSQEELINYRDRLGVFDVKPGITGPAQIAGIDMSTPDRLATADAEYLLMKSLVYDIRILAATVMRGFGLDAASSNSNSAKD